ncbi:AAA family ATPase [Christensenellaceae bacterium OttesenSCG-928-M15]|nr:AAA family ATPase [Christensenellaceae bacterium OttesenSCG-928-M15]
MKKCFGLLGETLTHSYSPMIYRQFGIEDYRLFSMQKEKIAGFLKSGKLKGLNVTIPYKKTVLPFCDTLSDIAKRMGNVNTLKFLDDGSVYGHNTDYEGFLLMLRKADIALHGKKIMLLGTGGAASTASFAARDAGAASITCISRKGENNYAHIHRFEDTQVLINCTPVGMHPSCGGTPVSLNSLPALEGVVDLVYNPWRTNLLLEAAARNIPCAGGLTMLVEQARAAASVFLSREIQEEAANSAYSHVLHETLNIVLTGMPGCGKSTTGRALAKRMSRPFFDTDDLILEKTGRTAAQIIETDGEAAMRKIEAAIIEEKTKESGIVLATGGGAILLEENRRAMRRNGRVYWLKRPLEALPIDGRPLSKNLPALYEARKPFYAMTTDAAIHIKTEHPADAADAVREEFYAFAGA